MYICHGFYIVYGDTCFKAKLIEPEYKAREIAYLVERRTGKNFVAEFRSGLKN
jgi:hypothetical protein